MILTSSTVTFTGLASNAEMLADWVKRRTREAFIGDKDWIVVGDFNIPDVESPLYKAITARGLEVPKALLGTHGTNLAADKRYDQILHLPQITKAKMNLGGVLDYYIGDFEELFPGRAIDKQGFTYELSDHLPLWVQLGTGERRGALGSGAGTRISSTPTSSAAAPGALCTSMSPTRLAGAAEAAHRRRAPLSAVSWPGSFMHAHLDGRHTPKGHTCAMNQRSAGLRTPKRVATSMSSAAACAPSSTAAENP